MIQLISQSIKNKTGNNINIDFRYVESTEKLPVLIFCHGFKGFKDWGGFPYLFEKFAEAGFFVVSFNFSHNGVGESGEDLKNFTRLDLFAKNTFSIELDDLGNVIDFLESNAEKFNYNFSEIILAGHSRGGGIAILKAAEDSRISKLITLASVSDFDRYTEQRKSEWKKRGFVEVINTRTKQLMRMDYSLIEDLEKNNERLNIPKALEKIDIPVLVIHGREDLAVDFSDAEIIFNTGDKSKRKLILVANTGHTFGIVHPFEGSNPVFENIISECVNFSKKQI